MKQSVKRIAGVLLIISGSLLLMLAAYNLFVGKLPNQKRNPAIILVCSVGFLYAGQRLIRNRRV